MKIRNMKLLFLIVVCLFIAKPILANENDNKMVEHLLKKRPEQAKALIQKGANPNAKGREGRDSALVLASSRGYTDVVRLLLDKGADPNVRWHSHASLMLAASDGYNEIVEMLIEKGAKVNAKNDSSWTALMMASHAGYLETVKILINHGAKLNIRNVESDTALKVAEKKKRDDVVEFLRQAAGNKK